MPPFQYADPGPNRYAGTLIDLLRERGAIDASTAERVAGVQAGAQLRRGDLRAQMVRDVAAVPGQVMAAHEQRQDRERNKQIMIATEVGRLASRSQDPALFKSGVGELVRMGVVPKEMGAHIVQTVDTDGPAALAKYALFGEQVKTASKRQLVTTTNAKGEKVQRFVDETSDEELPVAPDAPKPVGTRTIKTIENGVEVEKIVPDVAGAAYPVPTPEPKRYPVTVDDGKGNPVQKLVTEDEMAKGVPAYRAPSAAKSDPKFWVIRDGNPIRVSESEYQSGDKPASNREQGRPVTSGDARRISDMSSSLLAADAITNGVKDPGTLSKIQSIIPNWVNEWTGGWSDDAKTQNATIALVRQIIGKALEGGVLRKEDEIKYKDILPQLGETKTLVASKIKLLKQRIEDNRSTFLDSLEDSDYDVSKHRDRLLPDPDGIR